MLRYLFADKTMKTIKKKKIFKQVTCLPRKYKDSKQTHGNVLLVITKI